MTADPRRRVPRTDALLADPRLVEATERLGRQPVRTAVQLVQQRVRDGLLPPENAPDAIVRSLPEHATTLRAALNATGVVLHTNLGRAPLSAAAIAAMTAAAGYVDVEFDLESGRRARRGRGTIEALLAAVPGAQDALVVNNGAAALLLAVTALAAGREVLVSRGEMVEIGDGFRLPDLIESAGARIREVGTTNRTTRRDYAAAVGPDTGCLLKIHPSNFRIQGYTAAPRVADLSTLGVPVVADIGSGQLGPTSLLPDEPDAATTLADGASIVTGSGDKLLGGPQAGLLLGTTELIERLRRHPMARALRADKLTLAALEATLRGPTPPITQYLTADPDELKVRCEHVASAVGGTAVGGTAVDVTVVPSAGAVGGGGAPGVDLPGWAVALPTELAQPLRTGRPAVVGRIENGRLLLDLRCVPDELDDALIAAVRRAGRQCT